MSGPQGKTVLETIQSRLIPDEEAKKARGEVFTPLNLVREMLYGIRKSALDKGEIVIWGVNEKGKIFDDDPADRVGGIPLDLWRDPTTKWLDPANGIGNFPFVAFYMIDYQLKRHGKNGSSKWNAKTRRKHIVEKMLCMIEIDRGNVNTSYKIMEFLSPGSKANICCANSLVFSDEELSGHFGTSKFDVVMGNPPYNTSRLTRGQTSTLWDTFLGKYLSRLSPRGYIAFITPQHWRKPDHKLYIEMAKNRQLNYLRILSEQTTKREFGGVGSRVDVYLIENKPSYADSYVIDEDGVLNVLNTNVTPFIPNRLISKITSILTTKDTGIKIIHDSSMYGHTKPKVTNVKDEKYKYPIVKSITQKGIELLYSDKDKGHFGVPKVILTESRHQYPINDYEGKYGMSDGAFGIPITSKEQGDAIVAAINSDEFKEIIKSTKWGAFRTEYHMFEYFSPEFYKAFIGKE
jgi:hypothetical protein